MCVPGIVWRYPYFRNSPIFFALYACFTVTVSVTVFTFVWLFLAVVSFTVCSRCWATCGKTGGYPCSSRSATWVLKVPPATIKSCFLSSVCRHDPSTQHGRTLYVELLYWSMQRSCAEVAVFFLPRERFYEACLTKQYCWNIVIVPGACPERRYPSHCAYKKLQAQELLVVAIFVRI